MLKRLSQREKLELLSSTWEPVIRQAWVDALDAIKSAAVISRIAEKLEKQDVAGAVALLDIDRDAFSKFETAILQAYNAGGQATVEMIPPVKDPEGNRILFRWGVRNLAGEDELRRHAAEMVTGATEDMKEGLREILTESLAQGRNPHKAGLDAVGRINRVTGKREGGLLGLSSPQMRTAAWIQKAMREGDVEKMQQYLGLKLRNKRFDAAVRKAIEAGQPLPEAMSNRIFVQYSNRALDFRGKVVSRHETMMALDKSRDDAFRQQIANGKLMAQDVTKTWHHTMREHPRIQHIAMVGQSVGFEESFVAPDDTRLKFPRDPDAPGRHTIGCFCRSEYKISYTDIALRKYRARVG